MKSESKKMDDYVYIQQNYNNNHSNIIVDYVCELNAAEQGFQL